MSAVPLSETAAKRRIGDILLDHGFVTAEELAEATLEQERTQQPLGQILVGRGAITRLELASALAEQWSDPAASIGSSSRSSPAPAPVPAPSAQDEAQYAARLQEAVADLARKVQTNKPLEGIDERVDELSRRIEGTLARTQHIEAAVATLAESLEGVTTGVEEAFYALQTGTAELVNDLARIETAVSEIAARETPQDGPSLADLEELRAAVAELSGGTQATIELRDRVDGIAAQLDSATEPGRTALELTERVEQIGAQLNELRDMPRLDELQSTVRELESRSISFADVTERLEARLDEVTGGDPALDDALARIAQLDALLERTTSDVNDVTAALGRHEEAVADGRIDDLAHALEALRAEIAAVGASVRREEPSADRLDALEGRLERIAAQDDEIHSLSTRFRELEASLAEGFVTPDALAGSIERALSEREAPAVGEQVSQLAAQVEALRAEITSLNQQDGHPDPTDRLAEIESRIERLTQSPTEDEDMTRRIHELETARSGDLDTINVLAVAMDRIRHDLTTVREPVETGTSDVLESVATLAERVAALEDAPAVEAVDPSGDSELVSELERFRLMLERIGLHLGEHDRAIAGLSPSRGVEERLQELTVLVHDLAASQQNASAPQPVGTVAPIPGDISTLLQRVEDAESASQTDSEKLMNRLERMASSIDGRLQRLETDAPDDSV